MDFQRVAAFTLVVLLFLPISLVSATSVTVCLNNQTLQINISTSEITSPPSGPAVNKTTVENKLCNFGCDQSINLCKDDQSNSNYQVAIIIALGILAFIFAYLAITIGEEHEILQIGFMLFTMFLLFTLSSIASRIAREAAQVSISSIMDTVSAAIMWLLILILGYFLIVFIVRQVRALKKAKSDIGDD